MTKGQVKIEAISERLRLRWSHKGTRHCLSLGLPDNKVNQSSALLKAKQIELDMVSGNFDAAVEKYKPAKAQQKVEPKQLGKAQIFVEAYARHWEDFVEYKRSRVDSHYYSFRNSATPCWTLPKWLIWGGRRWAVMVAMANTGDRTRTGVLSSTLAKPGYAIC